ncbi:MAG: hypothetical protein ACAH83_04565 [Alphaproteobacteria bacterium]
MGDEPQLPNGLHRPLTQGEIDLAKGVFGDSLKYDQIRIHHGKLPGMIESKFQPDDVPAPADGNNLYYPDKVYKDDLSQERKGDFIHLMAYAWQFQNKIETPESAKKWAIANRNDIEGASEVKADPSKDLKNYNIEQRARLVEKLYWIREDEKNPPAKKPEDPDGSLFLKEYGPFIKNNPDTWYVKSMVKSFGITTDANGELHVDKDKWKKSQEEQKKYAERQEREKQNTLKVMDRFIKNPSYLDPMKRPALPPRNAPAQPRAGT